MQLTALLHKREQVVQELFALGIIIDFIELQLEVLEMYRLDWAIKFANFKANAFPIPVNVHPGAPQTFNAH